MDFEFTGELIHWRGPAPYVFIPVPTDEAREIRASASVLTYGWGVIPATVGIGGTQWTTSLFPKDGSYLVPVKLVVQRAEGLAVGDTVTVRLSIGR